MPRTRTTKKLAQRIDLNYFKRPHPFRRAFALLSVALSALALVWLGWQKIARDPRVYSSGGMSAAHAVLAGECAACHSGKPGAFRKSPENAACLACHDGPIHRVGQTFAPDCASCHAEHRGRIRLSAASDSACAQCHADLKVRGGSTPFARSISNFAKEHPEFSALRPGQRDPGGIKLNHAVHLRPDLRGPNGSVQLDCDDCHRAAAVRQPWRFGNAPAQTPTAAAPLDRTATIRGRALMAPPTFARTCAGCHLLEFDERFKEGVPHEKPEVVHAFVVKKFQDYIATHPAELRVPRDPDRNLAEKPISPPVRLLTPAQWVAERTVEAGQLLWKKTCKQCHTLHFPEGAVLPAVAKANITARWMPHAQFDHDAHRGFACVNCHAGAPTSKETSEILLPGIAVCRTCHAPGENHAEARCFECHTYHDWSQRKEVTPRFLLPALRAPRNSASRRDER